ncbi:MAG TPA: hypothetical protein VL098_08755 [Flavipsychrobacter sp.]|nr:hypothetical protein [Flavipsychrobacter sp.]
MRKAILIGIATGMLALQCLAGKKKHATYEFPPEMSQAVRDQYTVLCEKGEALYQVSCAKCHNEKKGGKLIIPDFTQEQLGAYSIRVANAQHEEMVSEMMVPADELTLISTFLTYKTKSGILMNGGKANDVKK